LCNISVGPCCIAANENYKKAIAHIDKTISGLENSIVERIRYFIDLGYAPTVSSTAGGIKTTKSTLTLPVGSNELPEFEKKLVSIPEFRDTFVSLNYDYFFCFFVLVL